MAWCSSAHLTDNTEAGVHTTAPEGRPAELTILKPTSRSAFSTSVGYMYGCKINTRVPQLRASQFPCEPGFFMTRPPSPIMKPSVSTSER
ncbi:hypothetical protein E2C01_002215 [Portunus trituberculatus]|uniref:Uncharacterized protein n=1 Tax=Portunus trituberculatus TaxID=210409 RepID=A0A5B7CLC5_PORTR|nr:hypothetical protein [Portunus trituberculatus]